MIHHQGYENEIPEFKDYVDLRLAIKMVNIG
jgi:hypothetical protein